MTCPSTTCDAQDGAVFFNPPPANETVDGIGNGDSTSVTLNGDTRFAAVRASATVTLPAGGILGDNVTFLVDTGATATLAAADGATISGSTSLVGPYMTRYAYLPGLGGADGTWIAQALA